VFIIFLNILLSFINFTKKSCVKIYIPLKHTKDIAKYVRNIERER